MISKNSETEIQIESMGSEGEGIGRTDDGLTVFVAGAIPGDRVLAHITKVKKSYAYAIIAKVLSPSSFRVEPKCPVASKCGGCTLLHMDYAEQLRLKAEKVKDCIERIGGIKNPPMEPIVGAENLYYYRNKAQFPVGTDRDGNPIAGFYRKHSHDVVSNSDCLIQAPVNRTIVEAVLRYMKEHSVSSYNEETGRGLVRHIFTRLGFATKELMVCLVINGEKIPAEEDLTERLKSAAKAENCTLSSLCLNVNKKNTNVIMGESIKLLYGREYIEDKIGDITYRISPLSFYQVNPEQTLKLYKLALEYAGLSGSETVWDLYCGIGTISLFLAKAAKEVYGVEIVPEAIEDAKKNAEINGITNAFFSAGAAEDLAPTLPRPDVIVVDPPRKGCDEKLIETILKNAPKRLVYVSCDPATLARDLKILTEGGYTLDRVRPVDQFLHGGHVETVVSLSRA